jgi:hypothetical protein
MGGANYIEKSRRADRRWAAAERAAITEIGASILARLPGHIVTVRGMGDYTALNVDYGAAIVYVWRAAEPDQVLPVPFARVQLPFRLVPGEMPKIED